MWDVSYATTDYIIATGGDKRTFYCPSDPTKTPEMANLWQFTQNAPITANPDTFDEPKTGRESQFRVTGYFWMMDTRIGRSYHPQGTPKKDWITTLNPGAPGPSMTELVTDATLSTGADPATASFTEVRGGTYSRWQIFDRTNHLRHDKPEGGNILYVDGHLEWRPFIEMAVRVSSPYPYHWW